ncbi:Maltase-glucoamylase, intestinal, partial [Orchesella cincta]
MNDGLPAAIIPCLNPSQAGYRMVGEPIQITNGLRVNLIKVSNSSTLTQISVPNAWEGEAESLILDAEFQSNYRLRVKIYNNTARYEVPLVVNAATGGNQNPLYEVQFENEPLFSFKVIRRSTGTVLFDTSPGEFIFADQYLALSWKPGSENVYGLGENEQHSFRHDFSQNLTWALWSRDQPPSFTANMYGVQPHLTVLENDGNAHTVVIVNSNAQQFSMLSGPKIEYITTGGLLDFYFFLGPTPENTVEQYTKAVGRPQMPPYWALGFQLCRVGYTTIDRMQAAVNRTAFYGIPQDVQYGDIDIMHKSLDFTYSRENFPGLPDYVRELKRNGIKFVTILDPCISSGEDPEEYRPLKLGDEMDVWVKKADGSPALGKVWPEYPCYFPDYSRNSTKEWWKILIKEFHDLLEYDGLWIDMNEPANFDDGTVSGGCAENNLNYPPFVPSIAGGGNLSQQTICADYKQDAGNHYDVHSLYGWFQSEPTLEGTREGSGKRSLVLSRSTFLGSGHWVAHWLGDNWSQWDNLHFSIIGMLQYNQFGVPFSGSDICGFLGNTTEQMCQRWMQLGAFYPFARNHNGGNVDQDPGNWGPDVAESSRVALMVRYTLLPYLYTLFYKSVTEGGTVARALYHNFPTEEETWGIDRQFMWGSGCLSIQFWRKMRQARCILSKRPGYKGGFETLVHHWIRLMKCLPTQEPALNTELSRNNPFGLIVALDDEGKAKGSLYFDDGDSIGTIENEQYFLADFEATNNTIISRMVKNGYPEMSDKRLTTVRLLGTTGSLDNFLVNGEVHTDWTALPSGEVLIPFLPYSSFKGIYASVFHAPNAFVLIKITVSLQEKTVFTTKLYRNVQKRVAVHFFILSSPTNG